MKYTVLTEIRWQAERFEAAKRHLYTQLTAILHTPENERASLLGKLAPVLSGYMTDYSESQTKTGLVQLHRFEALTDDVEKVVRRAAECGCSEKTASADEKNWVKLVGILEDLAFESDIVDITLASALLEDRLFIEFLDTVIEDWSCLDSESRSKVVADIQAGIEKVQEIDEADRTGASAIRMRAAVENMIHAYRSRCSHRECLTDPCDSSFKALCRLRSDSHLEQIDMLNDLMKTALDERNVVYMKTSLELGRLILEAELSRIAKGVHAVSHDDPDALKSCIRGIDAVLAA